MTFQNKPEEADSAEIVSFSLKNGDAHIEIITGRFVKVNAQVVHLTSSEFIVFHAIAKMNGQVATSRMLLDELYLYSAKEAELKIMDVFVCKIRTKLENCHPDAALALRTVWGRGYTLGFPKQAAVPVPTGLPKPDCRWVVSRKAILLDLVSQCEITTDQVLAFYPDLSLSEFREWQSLHQSHGRAALRTTRAQQYALS